MDKNMKQPDLEDEHPALSLFLGGLWLHLSQRWSGVDYDAYNNPQLPPTKISWLMRSSITYKL